MCQHERRESEVRGQRNRLTQKTSASALIKQPEVIQSEENPGGLEVVCVRVTLSEWRITEVRRRVGL